MKINKVIPKCDIVCPHCGGDDIVFTNLAPKNFRTWDCEDCGRSFRKAKRIFNTPPPVAPVVQAQAA